MAEPRFWVRSGLSQMFKKNATIPPTTATLKQCCNTPANPFLTPAKPSSGHRFNHYFATHFDVCLLDVDGVDFSIQLHFIRMFRPIGKQPIRKG